MLAILAHPKHKEQMGDAEDLPKGLVLPGMIAHGKPPDNNNVSAFSTTYMCHMHMCHVLSSAMYPFRKSKKSQGRLFSRKNGYKRSSTISLYAV